MTDLPVPTGPPDPNSRPEKSGIPKKSIYRLSIYNRCLHKLQENGVRTVSSSTLAKAAGVKPSQLRKDLAYFGQFGTRGLGYPVEALGVTIREALGREHLLPVILVGVGNLGSALLRYQGFEREGFEVIASFDKNPDAAISRGAIGKVLPDSEMHSFIREHSIKLVILCVPAEQGQAVTNELVASGVQAILNFSPVLLEVPASVTVNNVDLALELEHLGYFIR